MNQLEPGQRVCLPGGPPGWVTVDMASVEPDGRLTLYVVDDGGTLHKVRLGPDETPNVLVLTRDGQAPSARVLAGMWTRWMSAAAANARTTLLASSPLRPYAHQANAVYGAMLPQ